MLFFQVIQKRIIHDFYSCSRNHMINMGIMKKRFKRKKLAISSITIRHTATFPKQLDVFSGGGGVNAFGRGAQTKFKMGDTIPCRSLFSNGIKMVSEASPSGSVLRSLTTSFIKNCNIWEKGPCFRKVFFVFPTIFKVMANGY